MVKKVYLNSIGFVTIAAIITICLVVILKAQTVLGSPYPPPELVEPSQATEEALPSNPFPGPMEISSPGSPSPTETNDTPVNDALMMDVKEYAATFGVDISEALQRLELQADISELNRKLSKVDFQLWIFLASKGLLQLDTVATLRRITE